MSNELLEALSELLAEIERAHSQGDRVLALRLERIAQQLFRITARQFSATMDEMKKFPSTEIPQSHTPGLRKYQYSKRRVVRNRQKPNAMARVRMPPWSA